MLVAESIALCCKRSYRRTSTRFPETDGVNGCWSRGVKQVLPTDVHARVPVHTKRPAAHTNHCLIDFDEMATANAQITAMVEKPKRCHFESHKDLGDGMQVQTVKHAYRAAQAQSQGTTLSCNQVLINSNQITCGPPLKLCGSPICYLKD